MRLSTLALWVCCLLAACDESRPHLRLATTTSTRDSGLLDAILPAFEREAKVRVDVIAVGSGKALKLGEAGDVDVLLVHAREAEDAFMAAGHGARREDVMHNTFELLGPPGDPAQVKGLDVTLALARIAAAGLPFVSRGDDSGTHQKEKALWREAGGLAKWDRYLETGQEMGASLIVANEKRAYVLTDRATYLAFKSKLDLVSLAAASAKLNNPYGVIVVSAGQHPKVDQRRANAFADYLISARGQRAIGAFTVGGEPLFFPDRAAFGP
jgi:tungstate transport system substrate-binding protein